MFKDNYTWRLVSLNLTSPCSSTVAVPQSLAVDKGYLIPCLYLSYSVCRAANLTYYVT